MKRVFACIGFTMAITLIALNFMLKEYILIVTIGLVVLFATSLIMQKFRQAKVIPLCLGVAIFACLLFGYAENYIALPQYELNDKTAYSTFYVTSEGEKKDDQIVYEAKTQIIDIESAPQDINILLYVDNGETLEPYTIISGKLKFYSIDDSYSSSYKSDKIFLRAFADDVTITNEKVFSFNSFILDLRKSIKNKLTYILDGDEGGLSTALVIGDKSGISDDVKSLFSTTGTSHIMAISGLHLSLVVGVFFFLLKKFKLNNKLVSIFSILATLFYMTLAGFSGSVVRAGIMMIILMLSYLFSMRFDSLNSLGIAVFIICINPYAVLDLGSMYSVVAVLGLLILYPRLMSKYPRQYADPIMKTKKERAKDSLYKIFSVLLSSIAVGIFSLPISYLYYNSISVISPLTNIFVLPIGGTCVVLSLLTYIISAIGVNFITVPIALVTKIMDEMLINLLKFFVSFGNSSLSFDYRFGIILAIIAILMAVAIIVNKDKVIKLTSAFCVFVALFSLISFSAMDRNTAKIYVCSDNAIVAKYNDKVVVWGVDSSYEYSKVKKFLNTYNLNIDALVCKPNSVYSAKLSNDIVVNTLICDEFNDTILNGANCNYLEVQNQYRLKLDDDFELYYYKGNITLDVNGFKFSTLGAGNAILYSEYITDSFGKIDLNDGSVIYTIKDANTFQVRRLNQWQK